MNIIQGLIGQKREENAQLKIEHLSKIEALHLEQTIELEKLHVKHARESEERKIELMNVLHDAQAKSDVISKETFLANEVKLQASNEKIVMLETRLDLKYKEIDEMKGEIENLECGNVDEIEEIQKEHNEEFEKIRAEIKEYREQTKDEYDEMVMTKQQFIDSLQIELEANKHCLSSEIDKLKKALLTEQSHANMLESNLKDNRNKNWEVTIKILHGRL